MTNQIQDTLARQVEAAALAAISQHGLPGLAVGVAQADGQVYSRGFGQANFEQRELVTPQTSFRIGSISKTMTAIGLLLLWEEGRFDLDDPIRDYLKSYTVQPTDSTLPPVTFRHLLTHTGGIGLVRTLHDLLDPLGGLAVPEDETRLALADYYNGRIMPVAAPGEGWSYANHGFATIGQLIEDISGQPFADFMRERLFDPLGMQRTDYLWTERVQGLAQGYTRQGGRFRPVPYREIAIPPAGSVFSTVDDMLTYMTMLLSEGRGAHGPIIEPDTLRLMQTRHFGVHPRLPGMGLAFVLDSLDGHRIAWHNGGWPGFSASMILAPDGGVGLVLLSNTFNPALDPVALGLMRALLGLPPLNVGPRDDAPATPNVWPELTGVYRLGRPLNGATLGGWLGSGIEVEVSVRNGGLWLRSLIGPLWWGAPLHRADPADPLVYQGVMAGQPVVVAFLRDASGQVDRLGVGFDTLHKVPSTHSFRRGATLAASALAGLAGMVWWGRRRRKE